MTDHATDAPAEPARTETGEAAAPAKKEDSFVVFLVKLVVIVLVFRSFVFSPFNIPSESMLPRMWVGDYLLAAKWPYGYSRYSLPLSVPLIPGRILASQPDRGDIVIFKAPPLDEEDYVKRVIGLPGDTVEVRGGQVVLNGTPVPKRRVEDFVIPASANMVAAQMAEGRESPCAYARFEERRPDGLVCRYPQFQETLPGGRSYRVLDFGPTPQDDFPAVIVPEGRMFLMGDNRDNSQDSRFPATPNGGVGLVPQQNLVGRATIMMWSTDGSAEWLKPWTWFTAARWDRIGHTF